MLLSYTTSEEDNIPNLRIFAQNIRNNDEGPKLYEDTADYRLRLISYAFEEAPLQPRRTSFIMVF